MTTDNQITSPPEPEKPMLTAPHGDQINTESLAVLFENLTGRRLTPKEIDAARERPSHLPPR